MRTLLLLLLVVLAFLLVRWFTPAASTAAASGGEPAEAGVRFMPPPSESLAVQDAARDTPVAPSQAQAPSAESTPAPAPQTAAPGPAWPASLLASSGTQDEVRVGASLVHGTPAAVQEAALSLDKNRALMLESFSWAVAGERQMALSLSQKLTPDSVVGFERAMYEAALTGRAPVEASAPSGPIELAMEMALIARESKADLEARRYAEAASGFSRLLTGEIAAPWTADPRVLAAWSQGLEAAQREHRWNPRATWPCTEVKVEKGDSLIAIRLLYVAEHPGALLCTGLIERCNRLKGFLQPGQVLKIPSEPVRVVVDLEARWALYFIGDEVASAWPVGVGRPGEETPPGDYTVRNKIENPPWMKEGQEPIPFGDPGNPLGTRWIGWSKEGGKTSYGFHGTWQPESIGQAASDGCVRFLNEDVEELFQILPEGAPIRIQG